MRKLNVALTTAAVMAMAGSAQATPAFNGLRVAADHLGAVAQAQFVYGGREYWAWGWAAAQCRRVSPIVRTALAMGRAGQPLDLQLRSVHGLYRYGAVRSGENGDNELSRYWPSERDY
jgi:hypothetical protein